MISIFADDTRSTDLLATFFDDGSNLPDIASRHRRFTIPVPADQRTHGPELKRLLQSITEHGFVRVGG